MTRIEALDWFHSRGAALKQLAEPDAPTANMITRMENEGQLVCTDEGWCLTDKGRCDLHEGTRP